MNHRKILSILLFLLITVSVFGQTNLINGRVYDQETGQPIIGASIHIKETNANTTSAADGSYQIRAEVGQTIVYAFVGSVSQEIKVSQNSKQLDVELAVDSRQLSEVVITGALGIKRSAREIGTSAQLVDNEVLNQGKTVNPLFGLTSKVAGLRINMYDIKVDPSA